MPREGLFVCTRYGIPQTDLPSQSPPARVSPSGTKAILPILSVCTVIRAILDGSSYRRAKYQYHWRQRGGCRPANIVSHVSCLYRDALWLLRQVPLWRILSKVSDKNRSVTKISVGVKNCIAFIRFYWHLLSLSSIDISTEPDRSNMNRCRTETHLVYRPGAI